MIQSTTYQYVDNILSIPARVLYQDLKIMSYQNYKILCHRGKLVRTREGRGRNNEAMLAFNQLPENLKNIIKGSIGDPSTAPLNELENYIKPDIEAIRFFANYTNDEGKYLPELLQKQKATNCIILNAIKEVLNTSTKKRSKVTVVWQNLSDAVNQLDLVKYPHNLPNSAKRLRERYNRYLAEGPKSFVHGNEGKKNSQKIKGDVADFILALYALPVKMTIEMVLSEYNAVREEKGWPSLTSAAMYMWLMQPAQERIWTLGRHGKDKYLNKFSHKIKRDRSKYFPNAYWAIDGTKLDLVYFDPKSPTKMAANIRINMLFDIYSEKLIGWSFSQTEDHTDHFRAIKMAINNAGVRPYLLTYDNQSGHKSARMQDLYSNIVAVEGGTHYPHPPRAKNNPVEQLIGRLQKQFISTKWFSDKQNITAKSDDSHANIEFLQENKDKLPTKDQLMKWWQQIVDEWNAANHPLLEKSRNEVYSEPMPIAEPFNIADIMQYLWVNETKPITYWSDGITINIKKQDYTFEVYNSDGSVDIEFRRTHLRKKFVVRYDPDNLDTYVMLYEVDENGSLRYVANAEPKRVHVDIPVLMNSGDKEAWKRDYEVRKLELKRDEEELIKLRRRTNITPKTIIESQELNIKLKEFLPKEEAIQSDAISEIQLLSKL